MLTPMKLTSLTTPPLSRFSPSPPGCSASVAARKTFSGRTPTQRSPSVWWARCLRAPDLGAVRVHHESRHRPTRRRPDQVGLAEEVGHERGRGVVVELAGSPICSITPGVHHRDGVGHRHGLLLVVGHVHEGDADVGLDALQLDLHLAAQLEVEGAERLVEEQHLGPVDQRPGQRDPLLLAAGELGGRRAGVRPSSTSSSISRDLLLDVLDSRRRRPKATFSEIVRCGNSA